MDPRFVYFPLGAFLTILVLVVMCGRTEPSHLPPTVPAEALHRSLADQYASNSTSIEIMIEERQLYSILLEITNIEDNRVQQHLRRPTLAMDSYVECQFKNREQVRLLRKGNTIEVYGFLKEAFAMKFGLQGYAVKLEDCGYVK